jgi:hypothetical protein
MGIIKGPREHALTVHDGSHKYQKYKYKDKQKAHAHPKKEGTKNPSLMPPDPKGKMEEKGINACTVTKDSIQNLHG